MIASVNVDERKISVGKKAFELTQCDDEVVAIVCHEVAHILLEHHPFSEDG